MAGGTRRILKPHFAPFDLLVPIFLAHSTASITARSRTAFDRLDSSNSSSPARIHHRRCFRRRATLHVGSTVHSSTTSWRLESLSLDSTDCFSCRIASCPIRRFPASGTVQSLDPRPHVPAAFPLPTISTCKGLALLLIGRLRSIFWPDHHHHHNMDAPVAPPAAQPLILPLFPVCDQKTRI